jgi:hypothetical protein
MESLKDICNRLYSSVSKAEWVLLALVMSILFLFPAFYNSYPYVFSDTGTYISSGFENIVPDDRPIFYGLFIRHISLSESLWLVVLGQSILLVVALGVLQSIVMVKDLSNRFLIFTMLITAFMLLKFSALPFIISTLLPDVFTALPLLIALIILFAPKLGKIKLGILSVCYVFFALTHMSNVASLSLLFFILFFVRILFKITLIEYRKLWFISILTLALWIILPFLNLLFGYGFKSTKSSHIFIMATLIDNGLLKDYLNTQEDAKAFNIYKYKDSIPESGGDFMWSDKSILYKTGGWQANENEYNAIIKNIIFSKQYFFRWIKICIINTGKQLLENGFGADYQPYNEGSPPRGMVKWHFEEELFSYDKSGQNKGRLGFDFGEKSNTQNTIIILFILVLSCGFILQGMTSPILVMSLVTFFFILCNAAVTATFSCIGERYNSRVTWLIIFFGINYLIYFGIKMINTYRRK